MPLDFLSDVVPFSVTNLFPIKLTPSWIVDIVTGKGFTAEVSHEKFPEKVLGPLACSKRIAEQMAAHKAISVWKIIEDSSDS